MKYKKCVRGRRCIANSDTALEGCEAVGTNRHTVVCCFDRSCGRGVSNDDSAGNRIEITVITDHNRFCGMGNRVSGPNNGDMVHGVARVSEACEKVIGARCAFTAFHRIPDTDNCGFVCPSTFFDFSL